MPSHDAELLEAAGLLLSRRGGQRGRLPRARVRRSVSTAYYALFHFLLDEVGQRIVGTYSNLLERRRILARTISHKGPKTTLDKLRGNAVDSSVEDFLSQSEQHRSRSFRHLLRKAWRTCSMTLRGSGSTPTTT